MRNIMYIIILSYIHGLEKIETHLVEHRVFLDKYYALNKFICSGAQNPRTGGVILCNAANRDEVEQIVSEDPFNINGAATYQIIEFCLTKFAPAFESFV
jgi:uncharacterized protein YciI